MSKPKVMSGSLANELDREIAGLKIAFIILCSIVTAFFVVLILVLGNITAKIEEPNEGYSREYQEQFEPLEPME